MNGHGANGSLPRLREKDDGHGLLCAEPDPTCFELVFKGGRGGSARRTQALGYSRKREMVWGFTTTNTTVLQRNGCAS
jgi:hypothetical protein